jgi:DNA-binding winged helix-turn-helix (wHTH) protein
MKPAVSAGNSVFYRTAEVEVYPSRGCVRLGSEDQYLRPKTFQVLIFLIEQRSRSVPKEEILARVWKDTAVTEGVLVGCIAEIRKALGDDLKNPRFVKTLSKVGYRFVGPVDEIHADEQPVTSPVEPPLQRSHTRRWTAILAGVLLFACFGAWYFNRATSKSARRLEVSWWRFDDGDGSTARDSSGNNNIGFLRHGAVRTTGKNGRALKLDGVSGSVEGGGPGRAFPRGGAPRTLSAWIKTSSTNGDDTAIFNYGTKGSGRSANFLLGITYDARLVFGNGYDFGAAKGASRLDDDSWRFVAGVYEGPETNLARVFVDGMEEAAGKLRYVPETGDGSSWRIGRSISGGTPFRGIIGDVRVYSRALQQTEVQALYRCSSGEADLKMPGPGVHYYLPVFLSGIVVEPLGSADAAGSRPIRNPGFDHAGVQFARSDGACSVSSLRGEDVGQDLDIRADLLVPTDGEGRITQAGPYFRSRLALAGDGIIGGTSAGYWVQLHSTGVVKVLCLNPKAIVAFTAVPDAFDPAVFHSLEVAARGPSLGIRLDGKLLTFDQAGRMVDSVAIPATWEGPPASGKNGGAAGIAFGATDNRWKIGGQRAKNVVVRPIR